MKPFTHPKQEAAWCALQLAIGVALIRTPGEYDCPSLVDHVARDMAHQFDVPYAKIADYLEARYKAEDEKPPRPRYRLDQQARLVLS